MTSDPGALVRQLGYEFTNGDLLTQALTHRSAGSRHNERLEFLGDAVLGSVIAQALFEAQPSADEGLLTRWRAHLVNRETLAEVAGQLKLGRHLILGSGTLKSGGHQQSSILADALEAIIGAVHLDGGVDASRELVLSLFASRLANLPARDSLKDPKTRLQEILQHQGKDLPVYETRHVSGPDHDREFTVSCRTGDIEIEATARSRRWAEQAAAEGVLARLEKES